MTISSIKKRLESIEKVHKGEDIPRSYIYQGDLSQEILKNPEYLIYLPENHR